MLVCVCVYAHVFSDIGSGYETGYDTFTMASFLLTKTAHLRVLEGLKALVIEVSPFTVGTF